MVELRRQHPEPLPPMILQKEEDQVDDFQDILERLKRFQAHGKLLELGCLTGHFLDLARTSGYEVTGIEPDPWAAEYARRQFGMNIHPAFVADLHFDNACFDVIAMFHVMEHLTQPVETLLELRRILKDFGLLAIEIPVIDTIFPWLMGRHHRHFVFDHTLFFSRKTVRHFLKKMGFQIVHTELTGRRICLERIAWMIRRNSEVVGQILREAFESLGIDSWTVNINMRDNFRVYCRKATD